MSRKISTRSAKIGWLTLQGYNSAGIAKKIGGRTGSIHMAMTRLYDRMKIPKSGNEFDRQSLFILKVVKQNALDKLRNDLCPYPDTPCSMRGKKHEPQS